MKKLPRILNALMMLCCASLFPSAFAAGVYNDLQSVSAMGNAFAGAGVAGDDASISFYNPAGLMLLEGGQLVLSGIYAAIDAQLTVDSAANSFGTPIPGATGQQYSALPNQFSPALYFAAPLGETFMLGLNLNAPYELTSDYGNFVVNNTAKYTQLIAYTGNATLAMAVTDKLLLGLGANLQYFQAKLSAEVDASLPVDDPVLFLSGESKYSGDNIAFYPNLGAIYEFTDNTRVGLNYRMFVDQETKGNFALELDVKQSDSGVSDIGNYPAYSQFQFPDIVSLNFFHRPHEKVELLADVLYTHWSRMQAVSVNLFEPIIASHEPIDTDVDLRNTWRVGLGVNYYVTPEIKLRSGFAYDQSPVTDANRILQAPDADQFDVAIGLMYKPKAWGKTHIDFAYMHTFFKDGTFSQNNPVYRVIPIEQLDIVTAQGSFQNTANFVGLQLVHSM